MTKKQKNWFEKHPIISLFLVLFILAFIGISSEGDKNSNSPNSPNPTTEDTQKTLLSVGDEGRLYVEGLDLVGVATTKEALDELTKASVARDSIGYSNVYLEGRAFQVESNTKVLILDITFATRKIRILEGDYYGQSGWVPYEWVR